MPSLTSLDVRRLGPQQWQLLSPLDYKGRDSVFRIPAGYVTDFATVPQFVQWLVPRTGAYTLAAVVHDYMCDHLKSGHTHEVTSHDVDGIFRRIMREHGVSVPKRWLMWTGVRWGAMFSAHRRSGIARDLPLMLLLSVLFAPLVVPAALAALVSLGGFRILELLLG